MCNQEAAESEPFTLRKTALYLSACSTAFLPCILYTIAPNVAPDSCPPEVKPCFMKTICPMQKHA